MASIKIEANVQPALTALSSVNTKIKELQEAASKVKIEIKADGIENLNKVSKDSIKQLTQLVKATTSLEKAQNANIKSENALARAKEKTRQEQEKTAQALTKGANELGKTTREIEKTKQKQIEYANTLAKSQKSQDQFNQSQSKTQSELKQTGAAAEEAGKKTQGFISTFVKSAVIYQAIYAIRQAFMDALDTMKEVDSQLVTVRKVTQATDAEISQLRSKAYQTASKYGVGAGDYLESVAEFARAGYRGMSDSLAELSTKTQIVGDTTAEVANQFLLSMDAAYKYNGSVEKLTRVLDGANEIDNNYATSIQKIAEGLGLIAPIASQVHVSEQELTSAIGTITAVTQRSGSEAARALRALFLNIIGDTTTEIEDGVTATEESVTSLRTLLKDYAPDAVAAAEATGKIIDPMEAIGALSNAMKNGLLTEQELMEKLSSLGGKLRTSQLVALVSNFDMYQQMMGTYADSIGSADKEVENALDSWERKTAILANTWTEFIQGSLNTDFIKGFLDGLTQVIRLFGNLGNALMTVGGAFLALKLPSIVEGFSNLATKAKDFGKALGSSFGGIQKTQLAIAGITAAITAVTMAYNAHRQAVEEDIQKSMDAANASADEAKNVYELYQAYDEARSALEAGTGSKEALTTATAQLVAALSDEGQEAYKAGVNLDNLTKKEIENARATAEVALQKKWADLDPTQRGFVDNFGMGLSSGLTAAFNGDNAVKQVDRLMKYFPEMQKLAGATAEEAARTIVNAYDKAIKKQKEIATATKDQTKQTAAQKEEWQAAQDIIDRYVDSVDDLRTQLENLDMYDAMDAGAWEEMADGLEGAAEGLDNAADSAQKAASAYREIEGAAEEAKTAITEFSEATKEEVNDAFSSYADIYSKFLEDWEAGLKGTNRVKAAIDALLPEEAINELRAKGVDVGELLYNDFYKGIFEAKGEDFGSNLAFMLWDNDTIGQIENGAKVIKDSVGDVVATITESEGELSVSVTDFDKLAQTMYEITGIPLDANVWAAWMSALGGYSEQIDYTVTDLKNLAEAVGAVNESGSIDLATIVTGQLEAGESADKIWDLVDALMDADQKGEVTLETNAESVEEAREKVKELIAEYQKTHGKDGEVEAQTDGAEKDVDHLTLSVQELTDNKWVVKIDANTSAATAAISALQSSLSTVANAISGTVAAASSAFRSAAQVPANMSRMASGTSSAPGGITLVNEQGPEIIQDGAYARIAGGGMPTITWVQPGSTIYTAGQTKSILGNADPSLLFGGIGAFAGGTASGITRWRSTTSTAAASAAGTAVGSSAARGTSTSRINTSTLKTTATAATNDNDRLKQLKDIVSLRESELSLLQAQEAPVKDQINKNKQIQQALMDQINYMKSIGGSQEEINQLYTKWYKIQKDIADLQDSMYKELQNAVKGQIDKLNKAREEEKKALQDQIDAMKEARDTRDEQLELEEKILAVQKAEQALQNAMTERTVRFYNASTGQWEWAANASNVKSAAEQLESAQQALMDYQDNAAYNAAIAELEAQQDAIDAKYDDLETRWNEVIDSFEAPVKSIDEALNVIAKNYVPSMEKEIINLNSMIESFGYHVHRSNGTVSHGAGLPVYDNGGILSGVGGIKATGLNEMILPPDITQRMLSVTGGSLIGERLNELRYLYGVSGSLRGSGNTSIGSQHNGDVYRFGNISLSAAQAESMTVAELARASRNLRLYSANM